MDRTSFLAVGDGHEIYFEHHGDRDRPCFLYLHGGPGGGIRDDERDLLLDGAGQAVLFDQRGAGRSRCPDALAGNTTRDLVADIEALRGEIGVDRWTLFGGSWGSTLALAYAIAHPDRVRAMILWGIFLCRRRELDWFYEDGANHLYPDEFERFRAAAEAGDEPLVDAYHRLLNDPDRRRATAAARAWARWEAVNSFLIPTEERIETMTRPEQALPMARLETHYFTNGAFFDRDGYLLDEAGRLADIPAIIIQGRYDTICPPVSAWELHRALPKSRLEIVVDAAHDSSEPGNRAALAEAVATVAQD